MLIVGPNKDEVSVQQAGGVWISWLVGFALLAGVLAVAIHVTEERAFIELTKQMEPWWLLLALTLQAFTYVTQGGIWRAVARAVGVPLKFSTTFALSVAKLFIDQAIPSAGISGTLLEAKAFQKQGMPPRAVKSGIIINIFSFYSAFVGSLALAVGLLWFRGVSNPVVVSLSALFIAFGTAFAIMLQTLVGRRFGASSWPWGRWRVIRTASATLAEADPVLVRDVRLELKAIALQFGTMLLDTITVWVLLHSVGAGLTIDRVFASLMIASLIRTAGFVPGGLGTFEATLVLMLTANGATVPSALSVTLLFRGFSFWLPMAPGFFLSRRAVRNPRGEGTVENIIEGYWRLEVDDLTGRLKTRLSGLSSEEAAARLQRYGRNELRAENRLSRIKVLANQFRSPLVFLLVFAAIASGLTGEWIDATIVILILLATAGIGYSREYSAQAAAAALRERIHTLATVVRDGQSIAIPVHEVVPGDVVMLSAGSLVPADAVILQSTDCFVSEAVLTGESFPVTKKAGAISNGMALSQRNNTVFLGTNVRSGVARCLVVHTGMATEFGKIAHRLVLRPPETEFDRGIRHFGYLLTSSMFVMVLVVFTAHTFYGRPAIETLLFAVALAVGLSPELLPVILSVNLARGATAMARCGVLVRRLSGIENLGSMDILCTDKTGTLTEGVVQVEGSYDPSGQPATRVLELAASNAVLQTGLANPLDEAILRACTPDLTRLRKRAEIPFDFMRKRLSVVVEESGQTVLVVKGAFHHVLEACTMNDSDRAALERRYSDWGRQGIRVIGVATRSIEPRDSYTREDECNLHFEGFLTFIDRPKQGAAEAISDLARLGVSIKLITGDSKLVAQHLASIVGLCADRVLTGVELDDLHDEALWHAAERTDLFVEVDPNQKERIILSLKKMGHVVGFLGDGVNDAPAMHAADTSLSVESAVDVARATADFVLLEHSLDVIRKGIQEGRRTFANTLKYIMTTTSANLGNMVSMAAASLFLPFLPLTAGQILLNNFLSDIPAVGIADDSVDAELVERPRRWDIRSLGRFMVKFGILSSLFDFLTFGMLLFVFHAKPELFRTAWFVESLLTELVIALVVRTRRVFYRSRPGRLLLDSTLILTVVAFVIPYLPFVTVLGFVPLPLPLLLTLAAITVLYMGAAELAKKIFRT